MKKLVPSLAVVGIVIMLTCCTLPRECLTLEIDQLMPDLRGCDFNGANLKGFDFMDADLRGASFSGANLEGADFTNAQLSGKSARAADLLTSLDGEGQDLSGWDLSHMNLAQANLRNADLRRTNLPPNLSVLCKFPRCRSITDAQGRVLLAGSDLTGAVLVGANLGRYSCLMM